MKQKKGFPVSIWVKNEAARDSWHSVAERCGMSASAFANIAIAMATESVLSAIGDDDELTETEVARIAAALRGDGGSLRVLKQMWREQGAARALELLDG